MKRFEEEFEINRMVERRLSLLRAKLRDFETLYEGMPEGNLLIAPGTNVDSYRYYMRQSPHDKQGIYLDRHQAEIKKKLAEKKYVEKLIKNVKSEITMLEKVNKLNISDSIVGTFSNLNPGVRKLIDPVNVDSETYVDMWLGETYEGLGFDENDTSELYSGKNERMRSKSEVLIANALIKRGIPYKYECPVTIGGGMVLYPDFTILDIKNRKVKYWEHLGKMSDMSYVSRNMWKLDEYKKVGIYLGINLFVTYESMQKALGTGEIDKVIEAMLGMDF